MSWTRFLLRWRNRKPSSQYSIDHARFLFGCGACSTWTSNRTMHADLRSSLRHCLPNRRQDKARQQSQTLGTTATKLPSRMGCNQKIGEQQNKHTWRMNLEGQQNKHAGMRNASKLPTRSQVPGPSVLYG